MKHIHELKYDAPRLYSHIMLLARHDPDYRDGDGYYWRWNPRHAAAMCGCSLATVYRSASELERAGWIRRLRMGGGAYVRPSHP
ncbi:hypothetical protein EBZ80_25805 [bacterium]|nr:hypothetical protein [bacterium]